MKNLFLKKSSQAFKQHCLLAFVGFTFASLVSGNPQSSSENEDPITEQVKKATIEQLIKTMEEGYVFPEVAKRIGSSLKASQKANEFSDIRHSEEFAEVLTKKLQDETNDKHLRVEFNEQENSANVDSKVEAEQAEAELEMWKYHNFGFEKFERLNFNIGYFKLTAFGDVEHVAPLLESTMNLLNNSDSMIIDMRGNFGGEEETVRLLSSYFFDKPTHLINMYQRKGNRTVEHWSSETVNGKRFAQSKEVYILIDGDTFSAAEDFSYTMKNLKRAVLVGESTGGAANSGDFVRLTDKFEMFLPTGRGISPITKTNWAGTGVIPDVTSKSKDALNTAQKLILTKILEKEKNPRRIQSLKKRIESLK